MRHYRVKQTGCYDIRPHRSGKWLLSLMPALLFLLMTSGWLYAESLIQQKDANLDGQMDQTAHLDEEGQLKELRIDTNRDGREVEEPPVEGDLMGFCLVREDIYQGLIR